MLIQTYERLGPSWYDGTQAFWKQIVDHAEAQDIPIEEYVMNTFLEDQCTLQSVDLAFED